MPSAVVDDAEMARKVTDPAFVNSNALAALAFTHCGASGASMMSSSVMTSGACDEDLRDARVDDDAIRPRVGVRGHDLGGEVRDVGDRDVSGLRRRGDGDESAGGERESGAEREGAATGVRHLMRSILQ